MKNKGKFASFRCDFDGANANDKIMIEKILQLRKITQFNNKQLLNFLLYLGIEAIGDCQNFSDLLGMLSVGSRLKTTMLKEKDAFVEETNETTDTSMIPKTKSKTSESAETYNSASGSSKLESTENDTNLDELFQAEDNPEIEKMIEAMLDL